MFDLYHWEPIGDGYSREIEYCNNLGGFKARSWLEEITPWVNENLRLYRQIRQR